MAMVTYILRENEPLTPEQEAELDALDKLDEDDIFMDEECPPMIDEEIDWLNYMMNKYKTRRIGRELIELEKSQMTDEQRAAYDYMRAKQHYIIDVLKKHGGMKYGELKKYLQEHPFEYNKKSA